MHKITKAKIYIIQILFLTLIKVSLVIADGSNFSSLDKFQKFYHQEKMQKLFKEKISAQNYLIFRTGFLSEKVFDLGMSPVSYSGIGGNIGLVLERKSKHLTQIKLTGSFGKIKHREHRKFAPGTALTYHFDGSCIKLYKIKEGKFNFHIGFQNQILGNIREHQRYSNSSINYDLMLGNGITVALNKEFRFIKREMHFRFLGGMNLLGFGLRPSFAFSFPEEFYDPEMPVVNGAINSFKFISLHNHISYNQQLSVTLPFKKNTNGIRFFYDLNYYRFNFNNTLRAGFSVVGIDLMMSL